jgi:uncharacterized protein YyaL (SSP411 family)
VQIVVAGPREDQATRDLIRAAYDRSLPNRLLQVIPPDAQLPARHPAAGKGMVGGKPAAYVCKGQTCGLAGDASEKPSRRPSRSAEGRVECCSLQTHR